MSARLARVPEEIVRAMGAEPNEEQWAAISMPLEPYAIIAGAGSGKTSVMAARVVYLALVALGRLEAEHEGVRPGNVLCLTFTNKATEHLNLRLREALSGLSLPEGEEPEVVNYHGFAAQILERYGLLAGFEAGRRILSPAQRAQVAARVLDQMTFEHVKAEWQPNLLANILNLADQFANHCVLPEESIAQDVKDLERYRKLKGKSAYEVAQKRIELARAVSLFEELKREMEVIDFGDQIVHALRVVESHPEVRDDYRTRFQAVLLDEYQDTNVAQARLLSTLFGDGFPVTAVGDPDQNIYGWRGASLFNLLQFPVQFRRTDGTKSPVVHLRQNFRSGSRILAAADVVIRSIPDKFRPAKEPLEPFAPNGEGTVTVVRHKDEWVEATWIVQRILELHEQGAAWSDCAVLCRKSRLFGALRDAFAEHHVPVEIVGLAGLLKFPEVQEVLAYARVVADPEAGVSLARILMGPRYRVGFKDLAAVARWAVHRNREMRNRARETGQATNGATEREAPFLFSEALEHLDEVEGLSREGEERIRKFQVELTFLREAARRPVGEFLAEILRRTGLSAEIDASADPSLAAAARRNLAAFLDHVHAYSPVEGELTLADFLDYLATVEEDEYREWEPVQPSDDDSVKVMTIHVAKGLEFDHVFVPGMAKGIFPDPKIQQNPATREYSMDFRLRGDAEILPTFEGELKRFQKDLSDFELFEERRTCYVALTRARRTLWISGAHWYGEETARPKKPSVFLEELADWGNRTGLAEVNVGIEESGDENPLVHRIHHVGDWPGPARRDVPDPLFPNGWREAALRAWERGRSDTTVLDAPARRRFEREAAQLRTLAHHLVEAERRDPTPRFEPTGTSASQLRTYEECPKRYYWTVVRPLPTFSGPAARIGTKIHEWIERQATGQATLLELDAPPDLTAEELVGEPGKIERLKEAFLGSRFGTRSPLHAEKPFTLLVDGVPVSGRIDAIYENPLGRWEIVDYKTGKAPEDPEHPLVWLQLEVYGLACVEIWHKRSDDLTLTYMYLGEGGRTLSRPFPPVEHVRTRIRHTLDEIAAGRFDPAPGPGCRWCDFLPFCEPGSAWVRADDDEGGGT